MNRCNSYIIRHHDGAASTAVCAKCNQAKPLTSFYVHSYRSDGATRYRQYCKDCRRKGGRKNWARPVHSEIIRTGVQCCKKCGETKSLSDFYANGCFADGVKKYRTTCKSCVLAKAKDAQPVWYKSKCERRSSNPKNFISGILNHAAQRKQHLGFDIDIVFLMDLYEKQRGKCALSGVDMTFVAGRGRVKTNISIDRIDSTKGYVRGNVQLVCEVVNKMKGDSTDDEFLSWCDKVIRVHDEKIQNSRLGAG